RTGLAADHLVAVELVQRERVVLDEATERISEERNRSARALPAGEYGHHRGDMRRERLAGADVDDRMEGPGRLQQCLDSVLLTYALRILHVAKQRHDCLAALVENARIRSRN